MRDYSNSEMSNIIDEWIHSKRDREILKLCYIDGETYEKISEIVDLSPRRISTIIANGTIVIEKHLI